MDYSTEEGSFRSLLGGFGTSLSNPPCRLWSLFSMPRLYHHSTTIGIHLKDLFVVAWLLNRTLQKLQVGLFPVDV